MADFIIKNVRLSFPTLFEPQEFKQGDGKPRWSATFLVEPGTPADKAIREAIEAAAKEEWPKDWQRKLDGFKGNSNKYCYIDGDTKDYDGYAGMWSLAAHRAARTRNGPATPPMIVDKNPNVQLTERDGKPYAGCYVNAKVSIYCQSGENPGVRASFSVVQFASDGDAFSGSAPSVADLDDLSTEDESDISLA